MSYTPRDPTPPRRFHYAEDLTAEHIGQNITTTAVDGWPARGTLRGITPMDSQGVIALDLTRGNRDARAHVTRREGVIVHPTRPPAG